MTYYKYMLMFQIDVGSGYLPSTSLCRWKVGCRQTFCSHFQWRIKRVTFGRL